jgi:hypothetical protein
MDSSQNHHGAIVPSPWHVLALWRERVLGQMSGMRLDRVRAPVDQQVRTILHLTKRARDLTNQLRTDFARAVAFFTTD